MPPTPPRQLLLFNPELGHVLSVVSSDFSFLFFFKPKTPTAHVVRHHHPRSRRPSAPRAGFVLGEQPRPPGCCSLMGASVPSPAARLSSGLWALLAHSTLSLTALSNQHTPVLETGLAAQPLLLPCGFCTGPRHLNTFFVVVVF